MEGKGRTVGKKDAKESRRVMYTYQLNTMNWIIKHVLTKIKRQNKTKLQLCTMSSLVKLVKIHVSDSTWLPQKAQAFNWGQGMGIGKSLKDEVNRGHKTNPQEFRCIGSAYTQQNKIKFNKQLVFNELTWRNVSNYLSISFDLLVHMYFTVYQYSFCESSKDQVIVYRF